ncbi:hypothetical protein FKM82_021840 [Ascaphus truei]
MLEMSELLIGTSRVTSLSRTAFLFSLVARKSHIRSHRSTNIFFSLNVGVSVNEIYWCQKMGCLHRWRWNARENNAPRATALPASVLQSVLTLLQN